MPIRKLPILLLLVLVFLSGCLNKKEISGKAFVPQEVLVDVLVDIHLVDGITNDRRFYRRYSQVDSIDVLGPILEKHHITLQEFDTTMYAYSRHPELLDQVYSEVLRKLNIMMDENDQEEEVSKAEE
jgi:hypothetical protein